VLTETPTVGRLQRPSQPAGRASDQVIRYRRLQIELGVDIRPALLAVDAMGQDAKVDFGRRDVRHEEVLRVSLRREQANQQRDGDARQRPAQPSPIPVNDHYLPQAALLR
jgi:hypothetical protein